MTMRPTLLSRIVLVTDAWTPQVNGVVTTLSQIVEQLRNKGLTVEIIHPGDYQTVPLPFYSEIPLVWRAKNLEQRLLKFQADAIHIATEGPLGWRVRSLCKKYQWAFTTSYHTQFADYLNLRLPIIRKSWVYALLRRFHNAATRTLVPTDSIRQTLLAKNFQNLSLMTRGIQRDVFNPEQRCNMNFAKPMHLYVGRIATEKNLEAFLSLPLIGSKVVVGKGPAQQQLAKKYPEAYFVGAKSGKELASFYASADVFVFPSLTDTFGVVNLEAIACGTPVAAYPVNGPIDIIREGVNGALDENLAVAIERVYQMDTRQLLQSIAEFTWETAAEQFYNNLVATQVNAYHPMIPMAD